AETERFKPLFPDCDVIGLDYKSTTPWDAEKEFLSAFADLKKEYTGIILIANSIGAFFSLSARIDRFIEKAYFISPVVAMEDLILKMMAEAGVDEKTLEEKGEIILPYGETLSWKYLCYVRGNKITWNAPTEILYGGNDALIPYKTVRAFAQAHRAAVTVMDGGEHWFHTEKQLKFLDDWLSDR
ncbi:MAG TPA: alpha/beta hydrolase, partial [Clostridiales bacterium]|nr:alpha/beta hydrolase [Clostridiales bacterium]